MDAASLLSNTHNEMLRMMASVAGVHFEGVAQATRYFKGSLTTRQRRRLLHLDSAFSLARHITQPLANSFVKEIGLAIRGKAEEEVESVSSGDAQVDSLLDCLAPERRESDAVEKASHRSIAFILAGALERVLEAGSADEQRGASRGVQTLHTPVATDQRRDRTGDLLAQLRKKIDDSKMEVSIGALAPLPPGKEVGDNFFSCGAPFVKAPACNEDAPQKETVNSKRGKAAHARLTAATAERALLSSRDLGGKKADTQEPLAEKTAEATTAETKGAEFAELTEKEPVETTKALSQDWAKEAKPVGEAVNNGGAEAEISTSLGGRYEFHEGDSSDYTSSCASSYVSWPDTKRESDLELEPVQRPDLTVTQPGKLSTFLAGDPTPMKRRVAAMLIQNLWRARKEDDGDDSG